LKHEYKVKVALPESVNINHLQRHLAGKCRDVISGEIDA